MFTTNMEITSSNDTEMATLLTWIQSNYAAAVTYCKSESENRLTAFTLNFNTLSESITALTNLKSAYGARITQWSLEYHVSQ